MPNMTSAPSRELARPRTALAFEAKLDREGRYDWIVGAVDDESEGECYTAIFTGFNAEARAMEYAAWKNGHAGGFRGGLNN
jgi:hypothetical protein